MRAASRYAKNKSELAKRIPCARVTLDKLMRRRDRPDDHSEGNNRYDVQEWQAYARPLISAHNAKAKREAIANGHVDADAFIGERERSIIEKNKVTAQLAAFKLDVEMGEYIPREAAHRAVLACNALVVREFTKAFESELPPRLEGLTAVEIMKVLRRAGDRILANLHKGFAKNGVARA